VGAKRVPASDIGVQIPSVPLTRPLPAFPWYMVDRKQFILIP